MIRKFMIFCCIAVLIVPLFQCDPEGFYEEIDLPFIKCTNGVSASSALAMWSAYDGIWAHQNVILSYIVNSDGTVNHNKMVAAIDIFTFSAGWKSEFPATDNGQNQAISGVVESLENKCCSILPLIDGHYVPVVSARGHYENHQPIADWVTFHSFDLPDQGLMANTLKSTFYKPINGKFIAFLGRKLDMIDGLASYDWFIQNDGTYYGAPKRYEPKDSPII